MKFPNCRYTYIIAFLFVFAQSANAQSYARGLDFNDSSYTQVPKKAQLTRALDTIPSHFSLKQYAPYPKAQGEYQTCTAWACAYCARTMVDAIKNNWTNKDSITAKAYSPAFLFRLVKPNDNVCGSPSEMEVAMQTIKSKGCIHYLELPDQCIQFVSVEQIGKATDSKIRDFARLFDISSSNNIKIQAVKKAISEKKPVVIGMMCPPSFEHAYHDWQPTEPLTSNFGGHAMCVVGYDDNQYGGAFEVQNSWGENWGFEGYTWIHYDDFAHFVKSAYEFIDLPESKPDVADLSGSIKLVLDDNRQMPVNLVSATRGLKIVPAQNANKPLTVYQTAESYTSGTNFRIYISNDHPAYVYAISLDDQNKVFKVFPDKDGISAALTYAKNDVPIPSEDEYIRFDSVPGVDYLCVLYSKTELDINKIIAKVNTGQGSFNEKVFKAAGDQLVDPANIKFSNDKVAFQGISNGKDIVALMVELNHK